MSRRAQFSGDGVDYWKTQKADATAAAAVRALRTSFSELFIAKGFNTSGPFDSVDEMTFPEKKGSDFVIYPEFDVSVKSVIDELKQSQEGNQLTGYNMVLTCKGTLGFSGTVLLVVKEPLSGEKIWIKKVVFAEPEQTFDLHDDECRPGTNARDMANAWSKMQENVYQSVMKDLDRYVNAEEFVALKTQSADLRTKKVY